MNSCYFSSQFSVCELNFRTFNCSLLNSPSLLFRSIDTHKIPEIADFDSAVPLLREMCFPCQIPETRVFEEGVYLLKYVLSFGCVEKLISTLA